LVVCILIPRFPLLAAVGGRRERLLHPAALAPDPGGSQAVGEVSGAAEAFGVRAGMALGEALSRCPELALVTPDAERTESMWEELIGRLESVGAAVEPGRPGEAYFESGGLEGISGGRLEGVLNRVRRALDVPARIGAAPTRFASYAAAWGARGRGAKRRAIVPPGVERAFLASLSVAMLDGRLEADISVELERLGIRTLGELAALPSGAVADRFGAVGLRAHELAGGVDRPLRPRPPREDVSESLELPEAASGSQLAHALSLLVGRLLANPARRGRSFRRLRITGRLAAGGGWRSEVTLRQASAEPELLRLALLPRLDELPGPATRLGLQALVLGPLGHDQPALSRSPRERRRERLGEAVRQARAAGGRDAVLQVLDVDVRSRVPERRVMLTPFPEAPE
jgi:nucleotidyltransferase/DNA polymerase involved in DNA repair